jgi:hypothetical protein
VNPRQASPLPPATAAALEARFAVHVTSLLSERSEALTHDVTQRLKFARTQAIARARAARVAVGASAVSTQRGHGLALLGMGQSPRWLRLVSFLPLIALVVGLMLIQDQHSEAQIEVAADVDAALLADDLPPAAYGDAGFVEFLKTPRN